MYEHDDTDALMMNFATDEVAPQEPRSVGPVPPGEYPVMVEKVEAKPTSTGGTRVVFTLRITEGDFARRVIWADMNVVNKSSVAQEIGRRALASLLAAVDMVGERDLAKTISAEMVVAVKIKKREGYDDRNEVVGYKPASSSAPKASAPATKPAAPAQKKAPAFMR
jgi:hypothetical protein